MSEADLAQLRIDPARPRPSSGKRRLGIWLGLLAAFVAIGAYAFFRAFSSPQVVEVGNVTLAYPYQSLVVLNAAGYVVPQRKAAVASKATGRLEWLGVTEGSRVRVGEIIARLENQDVKAAADQAQAQAGVAQAGIAQAQAELQDAESGLGRAQELFGQRFLSQAALDTAQARRDKARAALQSARAQLVSAQANARAAQVAVEHTLIRAPFDGVVLTKSADVGDIVTPFSSALESKGAVVTMADMGTLEVEADVSESNLGAVRIGQSCEILLDALPEMRLRGLVSRLVPTVDRAKASVLVKVRFVDADPRVLPEMSAKVAFLSGEPTPAQRMPVTVVRPEAVTRRAGRSAVFRVEDGVAREIPVAPGEPIGEMRAVTGVKAGDRVVISPSERLRDQARVAVKPK